MGSSTFSQKGALVIDIFGQAFVILKTSGAESTINSQALSVVSTKS